ncbi:MAG: NAD(P)-dependent oxidoreductase [Marmoricola sp.]
MTTVGIWGGTGYAGSAIAREAISRGFDVKAIARNAPAEPVDGVEYRQGSVDDASLVGSLAASSDVVVIALHATGEPSLADSYDTLVAAAREHGTRLAFVGGAGSSLVSEGGPRLVDTADFPAEYFPEASAHANILERLRKETDGLDWFYVSPAAVFGAWAAGERTGSYRIGGDVLVSQEDGTSSISGADFALAFVDEIAQPRHSRKRFTVGN